MTTWKRPIDPYDEMTDEEVESYIDELFAQARKPPTVTISMRISKELLARVKEAADAADVPYQTFIKTLLESTISRIEPRLRASAHAPNKRRAASRTSRVRLYSPLPGPPLALAVDGQHRQLALASIRADGFISDRPVDPALTRTVEGIQRLIGRQLWLLVQNGSGRCGILDDSVYDFFARHSRELRAAGPIALLIESPGGFEDSAFELARLLSRECGQWTALIAGRAKSAGTLLALGASDVLMGATAELGPLDPQLQAAGQSNWTSVLQHLLDPYASNSNCEACRQPPTDWYLNRSRAEASELVRLVEGKAVQLLSISYPAGEARRIARRLILDYPSHDFAINATEANSVGFRTIPMASELLHMVNELSSKLHGRTVIGALASPPAMTRMAATMTSPVLQRGHDSLALSAARTLANGGPN